MAVDVIALGVQALVGWAHCTRPHPDRWAGRWVTADVVRRIRKSVSAAGGEEADHE